MSCENPSREHPARALPYPARSCSAKSLALPQTSRIQATLRSRDYNTAASFRSRQRWREARKTLRVRQSPRGSLSSSLPAIALALLVAKPPSSERAPCGAAPRGRGLRGLSPGFGLIAATLPRLEDRSEVRARVAGARFDPAASCQVGRGVGIGERGGSGCCLTSPCSCRPRPGVCGGLQAPAAAPV